ncbi:hypothetical protein BI344_09845 [Chromobacterium sphagni]|uniref:ESPR domain-containing protein n=1 Tax=Chromobacterium sphagni TaxID=1903179 RepID=A0ABX3CAS6_9NEIS|nr:hypothetical protein BI344_09845 [Chromobacterium sphagni]
MPAAMPVLAAISAPIAGCFAPVGLAITIADGSAGAAAERTADDRAIAASYRMANRRASRTAQRLRRWY